MPHLRDGTQVAVGDRLRFKTSQQKRDGSGYETVLREGLIFAITPGASSCNAQVAYPILGTQTDADGSTPRVLQTVTTYVTLGECEPAG